MSKQSRGTAAPSVMLLGGGGENVPGDRETRYTAYDPTREEKNQYGTV